MDEGAVDEINGKYLDMRSITPVFICVKDDDDIISKKNNSCEAFTLNDITASKNEDIAYYHHKLIVKEEESKQLKLKMR